MEIEPQAEQKDVPRGPPDQQEMLYGERKLVRYGLFSFKVFMVVFIIFIIVLAMIMATPEQRIYGAAVLVTISCMVGFGFYVAYAFKADDLVPGTKKGDPGFINQYLHIN
jgi:hypothetical protein